MRTENLPTATATILEQHRRDIEALDRRILHLVCERLELARQIGDLKQRARGAGSQLQVEAEVYRRFEDASSLLGSRRRSRSRSRTFSHREGGRGAGDPARRGLFGRCPRHGRRRRQGRNGPVDRSFPRGPGPPGKGHRSLRMAKRLSRMAGSTKAAADADLIIVAVPMTACAEILEELGALRVPRSRGRDVQPQGPSRTGSSTGCVATGSAAGFLPPAVRARCADALRPHRRLLQRGPPSDLDGRGRALCRHVAPGWSRCPSPSTIVAWVWSSV